jgi:hypothetical protein
LILFSALSALTAARRIAIPLAVALAFVAGYNNFQKFGSAADQLKAHYQHEQEFAALMRDLTAPDDLIVCGLQSLKATGTPVTYGVPSPSVREAPIQKINSTINPNTCFYSFEGVYGSRQGWRIYYEHWSSESLKTFAERGAKYFVTSYEYGLKENSNFFDELDTQFTMIARTPEWAIYDLRK